MPLVFAASCDRGVRPEPPDAASVPPLGGKPGAISQGDGMLCSRDFVSWQHTDAGGDGPPFAPSDVLILFDGSESSGIAYGSGTRASTMADAIKSMVDRYQRRIAFGLMRFPDASCGDHEGSACCVGAPLIDMDVNQGAAIAAALDNRPAPQGSSPLALALQTAAGVFQARQDQVQSRMVLLASDGQPGCGLRPGDASVSSDPCQEAVRAVQAFAKLNPPVRTLVLSPGPGDPEGKADCLRALSQGAAKDMQARDASMPSDGFNTGNLASLMELLESTFVPTQMPRPSCTLELGSDPMPNSRFAVFVDGQPIPESKQHGWWVTRYHETPGAPILSTVTLYGEYCTRLQQYRYNSVEVRYDCSIARLEPPKGKGRSRYCRT